MPLSILVSWISLKIICFANQNFLSFLYISSGKSTTNARLLGGLAISASMVLNITTILFFFPETLNQIEKMTLITALVSIFFVTFYGYIDDKFEVRVRFKLTLQLTSILSFAYLNAHTISPQHPALAFVFSSILGLALVNGTNLLDGLDTLSVKLGITSSLAFLYLGVISGSTTTVYLSLILISTLTIFYFFNREPAKVYMGEIGGSLIGLIYYIQSSICFSELKARMSITQALALVLIAGCFPVCELGISFLRRIWSKKTPFCGDRLHLHYVLKNKYKLSASQVSSRMGFSNMLILSLGFLISQFYNSIFALCLVTAITLQTYLWFCLDEWRSNLSKENYENVFKIFEGKTVNIIDSTQYSTLDISLDKMNVESLEKKSA
jgi:UDP-N-acetylmuramyl pentapeptide phosphotransferase/UDP-N-acetylglucosamine-1-phosphate transferase